MAYNREASVKHRKIRKGTRSCWECKRRKTKCMFASSGDVACIGCQARRSVCVSQELPEVLPSARRESRQFEERISRLEDVIQDLHASKDSEVAIVPCETRQGDDLARYTNTEGVYAQNHSSPSFRVAPVPEEDPGNRADRALAPFPVLNLPGVATQLQANVASCHSLWEALPKEADTKILLRESPKSSRYTHMINLQPHSRLTCKNLGAPYPPATVPQTSTHPVVLVEFMLQLAITLQCACEGVFSELSEPPNVLGRRMVTTAMTWLMNNEETRGTIENLICTMLEAVFETNCGNLRQAWAVFRRAMTSAQMMGLHRSPLPPVKRIRPSVDVDPAFLWFRIIYMDRSLSLLLGLPQGTYDRSMGVASVLQCEPPLGQFERQLTVIASSILERNENSFVTNDVATILAVDSELLRVSQSMPASFWRAPNFQNLVVGSPENLLETVKLSTQVYYYGLLIQLHLPYMMHKSGDHAAHEYSRITCVNASREIVTRFTSHRTANPKSSCSRLVDFHALLASMTLVLAHLDAHHHRGTTNLLAHQRLSDRAILDQALERMDVIGNVGKDVVLEKSASWIRRLMDIEADAAGGSNYIARSVVDDEMDEQEETEEKRGELRLLIPYLGIIKISRQSPISREWSLWDLAPYQSSQVGISREGHVQVSSASNRQPLSQSLAGAQALNEEGSLPLSEALDIGVQTSAREHVRVVPDNGRDNMVSESQLELPSIAAGVEDWVFQGVDMAFFDNLMRGTSDADLERLDRSRF